MCRTGRVASTGRRWQRRAWTSPSSRRPRAPPRPDEWYHRNRVRARRAGLYVAAYHFAHPGLLGHGSRAERIRRDARSEAHFFLRNANLSQNDLIPALDLELLGRPPARGAARLDDDLPRDRAARHRGQADGLQHGLVLAQPPGRHDPDRACRLSVSCGSPTGTRGPRTCPVVKWLGRGWTFWQWTDCGRVPGIDDCVDRNTYTSTRALKTLRIRNRQVRTALRPRSGQRTRPGSLYRLGRARATARPTRRIRRQRCPGSSRRSTRIWSMSTRHPSSTSRSRSGTTTRRCRCWHSTSTGRPWKSATTP